MIVITLKCIYISSGHLNSPLFQFNNNKPPQILTKIKICHLFHEGNWRKEELVLLSILFKQIFYTYKVGAEGKISIFFFGDITTYAERTLFKLFKALGQYGMTIHHIRQQFPKCLTHLKSCKHQIASKTVMLHKTVNSATVEFHFY